MAIKKIQAKTMREALALIKQTFGGDAIILSNKETPTGVEFIVTDNLNSQNAPSIANTGNNSRSHDDNMVVDLQTPGESAVHGLRFELNAIKSLLQEQLAELTWDNNKRKHPIQAMVIRRLIQHGFSAVVSSRIASGLEQDPLGDLWLQVKNKILSALPITNDNNFSNKGLYAFFGQAGVGKTTVIAKLAAQFALKFGADNVAIISTDHDKIAGSAALKIYAKILNIPIRIVENIAQMRDAVTDFKKKHFIMLDTPAVSPTKHEHLRILQSNFPAEYVINKFLVVPANMSIADLERCCEFFQHLNLTGCVITKIDEAISLGAVISSAISQQLPIYYLSDGQKVPDNIHPFSPAKFVEQVLNLHLTSPADDEMIARSMADINLTLV